MSKKSVLENYKRNGVVNFCHEVKHEPYTCFSQNSTTNLITYSPEFSQQHVLKLFVWFSTSDIPDTPISRLDQQLTSKYNVIVHYVG